MATACCTILLLMAGALVTSNDAADSVPDWPLAYGKLIPPLIGGIRFEYTHRVDRRYGRDHDVDSGGMADVSRKPRPRRRRRLAGSRWCW